VLSPAACIGEIEKYNVRSDNKLFIKNMDHLVLVDEENVFYISGTTEKFDDLSEKLKAVLSDCSECQ